MGKEKNIKFIDLNSKSKTFSSKPKELRQLINEALHIISSLGIPLDGLTSRRLECMAMAFLAVLDVKTSLEWKNAKDLNDGRSIKTRDIIDYWNNNFGEKVSSGSYDDVRRKDLILIVLVEVIIRTKPDSARNDPSRGYALNPEYSKLIRNYGAETWESDVSKATANNTTLKEKMAQTRNLKNVEITIPTGAVLEFSPGEHNILQKDIIEKFLPRFGFGAEVLYLGDTAKKHLINNEEKLKKLGFFELEHGELPDIITYSENKNWLYVIEAVYSCNPIDIKRKIKIEELCKNCVADIVYISAFPDRKTFMRFAPVIAWETEVWIAEAPDHMIHFNGDKFLGPHEK